MTASKQVPVTVSALIAQFLQLDQTAFIHSLLASDGSSMDYFNSLTNYFWFSADLSTGLFAGTHQELMDTIGVTRDKMSTTKPERQYHVLADDLSQLETASSEERFVFSWLAVPFWLAVYLKDYSEVVLIHHSACWWGRTNNKPLHEEALLTKLADDLNEP